jgi:hypothetical protein
LSCIFRALRAFFQDVLGIVISGRFLAKQIKMASGVLKGVHEQLMERLRGGEASALRAGGRKTERNGGYGRFGLKDTRYSSSRPAAGKMCLKGDNLM